MKLKSIFKIVKANSAAKKEKFDRLLITKYRGEVEPFLMFK